MDVHSMTDDELHTLAIGIGTMARAGEPMSAHMGLDLLTELLYWRGRWRALQTTIHEDTYHRGGGPYHCFCAALIGWEDWAIADALTDYRSGQATLIPHEQIDAEMEAEIAAMDTEDQNERG